MKITPYEAGFLRPMEKLGEVSGDIEARQWAIIVRCAAARIGGGQALARKLGVSKGAPSNWMSGRWPPREEYRNRLLRYAEEGVK